MSRFCLGRVVAVLACVLGACAAEVGPGDVGDDEAVLDHVEALGYARESAEIEGDHVLVDGDLLLERGALLEGAYERPVAIEEGGLIEKGYRYLLKISSEHRGNVRLEFATGKEAPTKAVRDAFIAAAKAWSSIPGSSLRVSTTNTGPAIRVRMLSEAEWAKPGAPCRNVDACANPPARGVPGVNLFIRSSSRAPGCTGWSGTNLINVTRHELGHALGFTHPKYERSQHVPGTKMCTKADEEACADDPNLYPTIMGPALVYPGCSVAPARLTQDDYATAKAVYPAPR